MTKFDHTVNVFKKPQQTTKATLLIDNLRSQLQVPSPSNKVQQKSFLKAKSGLHHNKKQPQTNDNSDLLSVMSKQKPRKPKKQGPTKQQIKTLSRAAEKSPVDSGYARTILKDRVLLQSKLIQRKKSRERSPVNDDKPKHNFNQQQSTSNQQTQEHWLKPPTQQKTPTTTFISPTKKSVREPKQQSVRQSFRSPVLPKIGKNDPKIPKLQPNIALSRKLILPTSETLTPHQPSTNMSSQAGLMNDFKQFMQIKAARKSPPPQSQSAFNHIEEARKSVAEDAKRSVVDLLRKQSRERLKKASSPQEMTTNRPGCVNTVQKAKSPANIVGLLNQKQNSQSFLKASFEKISCRAKVDVKRNYNSNIQTLDPDLRQKQIVQHYNRSYRNPYIDSLYRTGSQERVGAPAPPQKQRNVVQTQV